jgi:dTDP-4-amino-4,6-dideoxygalactose transaminase
MKKIRLSKSSISAKEKVAVKEVLNKEFLGIGEEVQKFEQEIKSFISTEKEVVCVNTGTAALHISLAALNMKKNDEVLVPSITYVATYQAISATGALPVSCDVKEDTLFMDLDDAEKKITKRTKVILPVHYASDSQYMGEVYDFAKKYNLRVIEDAAHSFGCIRNEKFIGVEGDVICFSFDGIKNITSGEGGAVLSSDKNLIQKIKDMRLLGVEKDTEKRYRGERSWEFDVIHQGFRYHMSNIMAAIGRVQLQRINEFKQKRQKIAKNYISRLEIDEIEFLKLDYDNIIPHIFVIKVKDRNNLIKYLIKNCIECGIHYKPNHLLTKYRTNYSLPVAERLYEKIISLPCHYDLTEEQQNFVINKVKEFYGK